MSSFVFQNRTCVYFGADRMNNIPHVVKHYGKRVLILTGHGSARNNGTIQCVMEQLEGFDFQIFNYDGINPNPTNNELSRVVAWCRKKEISVIIAIGGGSVIDSAKAISAVMHSEYDSVWDYFIESNGFDKRIPVIAIPTTIGTGSEMNGGVVLTETGTGVKRGFGSTDLQPVAAFYNALFTRGLSEKQIAAGVADIIAHVFDSGYFANVERMDLLISVQGALICSVVRNARILINDSNDDNARENLMWASAWGLNGFLYENLKQDASIHRIAHQLTVDYDIPHGEAVAIVMPRWLRLCMEAPYLEQISLLGIQCFDIKVGDDWSETAKRTVDRLENFLYKELLLEKHLSHWGVQDKHLKETVKRIMRGGLIQGLKLLDEKDVSQVLEHCL